MGYREGNFLPGQDLNIGKDRARSHIPLVGVKRISNMFSKRGQCSPPLTKSHCELCSFPKRQLSDTGLLSTVLWGFVKTCGIRKSSPIAKFQEG
jgi:hypothetical protein